MSATFDASYEALTTEQQRAYRLLGLHPGPNFDAAAAAAVFGVDAESATALLDGLVQASLIYQTAAGRFGFHDLARQHADQLAERTDSEQSRHAVIERLADWYLRMAVAAQLTMMPHRWYLGRYATAGAPAGRFESKRAACDWEERELPNLVAVQAAAYKQGLHRETWELAEATFGLFSWRKHSADAMSMWDRGAKAAEACGHARAHARMLIGLAQTLIGMGEDAYASDMAAKALDMSRDVGHRLGEGSALEHLGIAALAQGDAAAAGEHFAEARAIHVELDRPRGVALMDRRLGQVALAEGRIEAALRLLYGALDYFTQTLDEPFMAARIGLSIGTAEMQDGHLAQAERALNAVINAANQVNAPETKADAYAALADLAERRGYGSSARKYRARAATLYEQLGSPKAKQT